MSSTTWTGEQLQAHLDAWKKQIQRGEWTRVPSVIVDHVNGKDARYWVEYEGVTVTLTQMQAGAIASLKHLIEVPRGTISGKELQALFAPHLPQSTPHDGQLERGYLVELRDDRVVIRDNTCEYVELLPQQALSLLDWLTQERPRLEQFVKEG